MLQKRTLTVSKSQQEVAHALEKQKRKVPPVGTVSEHHFTIYKSPSRKGFRRGLIKPCYRFRGEFCQTGAKTTLVYTVFPAIPNLFLPLFLVFFTLLALFDFCMNEKSLLPVLAFIVFDLAYWWSSFREQKECIQKFEACITGSSDQAI